MSQGKLIFIVFPKVATAHGEVVFTFVARREQ